MYLYATFFFIFMAGLNAGSFAGATIARARLAPRTAFAAGFGLCLFMAAFAFSNVT